MDSIIIAFIAGVIGTFIYRASLPLFRRIERMKDKNLGEDKTILGFEKTDRQLLKEKIELAFDTFILDDVYHFEKIITSGKYYDGIEIVIVYKDILNYQKDDFLQKVRAFCVSQDWYKLTKVYIEVDKGDGVIIVRD